jgi:hypothetical protein
LVIAMLASGRVMLKFPLGSIGAVTMTGWGLMATCTISPGLTIQPELCKI